MLEFLKPILGEAYTEDIDKKVSEEIGKAFVSKADFNTLKDAKKSADDQLVEAGKTIAAFKEMDIDGIKKSADDWKTKYEEEQTKSAKKLADIQFETALTAAITGAKGRNPKPIMAVLDVETLKASKNQEADITAALQQVQKEHEYLFESALPPTYAPGTGGVPPQGKYTAEQIAIRGAAGLKTE